MLIACDAMVAGFGEPVLGPLSLRIAAGERRLITGPNGSGKSLLLKALTGRARVFSGTIHRAEGLSMGYLAQEHPRPGLWPLNGRDWFAAMGTPVPVDARLQHLLGRRLDQLSGGQWQLLRLAAVLGGVGGAPGPSLLLLDEPSNHLDAGVRAHALELLAEVPAAVGILVTSHDQAFMRALDFVETDLGQPGDPVHG